MDHTQSFLEDGFCIVSVDDVRHLESVRRYLVESLRQCMPGGDGLDDDSYLNRFHTFCDRSKLNDVRVKIHQMLGSSSEFKGLVYDSIKRHLQGLIGTEVAMQRQVNFVIQVPNNPHGLLYLHTDSWAGCSPYEVILWLPLVQVAGTKSMFVCPKKRSAEHLRAVKAGSIKESAAELMERARPDLQALSMKFGEALLFSPILLHGAEDNTTDETRFVLNVRFKSLFSPYGTKALGETFMPLQYLPATQVGLEYEIEFGPVRG